MTAPGLIAAGSSCREVQELPGLICSAVIQLLQDIPWHFALVQDKERMGSTAACVSSSGVVLVPTKVQEAIKCVCASLYGKISIFFCVTCENLLFGAVIAKEIRSS